MTATYCLLLVFKGRKDVQSDLWSECVELLGGSRYRRIETGALQVQIQSIGTNDGILITKCVLISSLAFSSLFDILRIIMIISLNRIFALF